MNGYRKHNYQSKKNSVQLRKVSLLGFSKTHEFCISKAAFTISSFAAVNHNCDHEQ